jgi:hypothetical protein
MIARKTAARIGVRAKHPTNPKDSLSTLKGTPKKSGSLLALLDHLSKLASAGGTQIKKPPAAARADRILPNQKMLA